MGSILENIGVFIIMSLVVWMIIGFVHMMLHIFNVWDRMAINIKLPKRKRFLNKVDPIYELDESNFGGFAVRKWELGYDDTFG
jgi:hypothetical protein